MNILLTPALNSLDQTAQLIGTIESLTRGQAFRKTVKMSGMFPFHAAMFRGMGWEVEFTQDPCCENIHIKVEVQ